MQSRRLASTLLALSLATLPALAHAINLRVLGTPPMRGVFVAEAVNYENLSGHRVFGQFEATASLRARLDANERCDLVVIDASAVDAYAKSGKLDPASVSPLARPSGRPDAEPLAAAICASTRDAAATRTLLEFLRSDRVDESLKREGLERIR